MTPHIAAAAVILTLAASALPAYADDAPAATSASTITVSAGLPPSMARPKVLPALYASYAALQAYDVYSTKSALSRGGREVNPMMQGVVKHTSAFVAVKLTVAAASIIAAERMWKTNKVGAIAVMVASNSVAAIVAARNARTFRQLR